MTLPPEALPPRPGPLAVFVGAVRVAASLVAMVGGTAAVLAAAAVGGPRLGLRAGQALCRTMLTIADVTLDVADGDQLRDHRGFVFFNHLSYLDPLVLVAASPMRFLSTAGVRTLPLIGWMASAVGTVFVNRGRAASRESARSELREAVFTSELPVALAPEGRIGPGPDVLPLRHGAFEVAADVKASILLVRLDFEPYGYAAWLDGEWLPLAYWRLCARVKPVVASLRVLDCLEPGDRADAPSTALRAEAVLNGRGCSPDSARRNAVLRTPGGSPRMIVA